VRFDLKSPCDRCPFTTRPIPLRAGRVEEIAAPMLEFPGKLFMCHHTAESETDTGEVTATHAAGVQHCAGALIFAEQQGHQTLGMMLAQRLKVYDPAKLRGQARVYKSLAEMKAAHAAASGEKPRRRRRPMMKETILQLVTDRDHVSFVEMQNAIGEAARGHVAIEMPAGSNVILWCGMSQEFCDALAELKEQIAPVPAHFLVYLADGGFPRLPMMKGRIPKGGFKTEHWCPVVWRLKSRIVMPKLSARRRRENDQQITNMSAKAEA
jgi:hypothetical protein